MIPNQAVLSHKIPFKKLPIAICVLCHKVLFHQIHLESLCANHKNTSFEITCCLGRKSYVHIPDFWWWLINMFFSPYTWLLMMAYKYVRRHRNTGISHWMGNDRAHEMPKWAQRLQQEFDDLVGLDKKVHESDLDKFPYIPQMHHQRNTPTQLDSHRELCLFLLLSSLPVDHSTPNQANKIMA